MSAVGQLNDAYYIIKFYSELYNYLYPLDRIKLKKNMMVYKLDY